MGELRVNGTNDEEQEVCSGSFLIQEDISGCWGVINFQKNESRDMAKGLSQQFHPL